MITAKAPKNLQAIRDWVSKNRPDCSHYLPAIEQDNAMILLMTMAFEAGRTFQKKNPKAPMGGAAYI